MRHSAARGAALALLVLALVAGCKSVELIAPYDPEADRQLVAVLRASVVAFTAVEAGHEPGTGVETELRILRERMLARGGAKDPGTRQAEALATIWAGVGRIRSSGRASPGLLEIQRGAFEVAMRAAMRAELERRRAR